MSNADDYNKLVDFIGNIIKATSETEEQEDIDNALNIAHTVGDVLKNISNDDSQK